MTTRVTLQSLPDGRVVVDKQSLPTDSANRKQEAQWLALARNQGIVRLVGVTEDPFTIRTAHAGTTTLRTARPAPRTAARLLGSTAETLTNLHERNLAHGKLAMDHIIVSGDARTTLCSPDGTVTDAATDLAGLGQIVDEMIERWDADSVTIDQRSEWQALADRLKATDASYTARRAQMALARLASDSVDKPTGPISKLTISKGSLPKPRLPSLKTAAGVAGIFVVLAAVASWSRLTSAIVGPPEVGPALELIIGPDLYQVGDLSYVAVAVPTPCEGQPVAVLLDSSSVVWVFSEAGDGVQASSLAQVPGATDLTVTSADGCGQVWATGPAGQSLVVGS